VSFALRAVLRHVDWGAVGAETLGLPPAIIARVLMLDYLSVSAAHVLQLRLGIVIIISGLHVMMWPAPRSDRSGSASIFPSGVLGGILSGMYAIGGPPLINQFDRQPLQLLVIRNSLIVIFAVASLSRLLFVWAQGGV
jgi:uncharacterized membrane protein YfcA